MVDQRNDEQKRGGAEIDATHEYVSVAAIQAGKPERYGFFWSGLPGEPPPRVAITVHHFTLGDSDAEVAQTCAGYAELL